MSVNWQLILYPIVIDRDSLSVSFNGEYEQVSFDGIPDDIRSITKTDDSCVVVYSTGRKEILNDPQGFINITDETPVGALIEQKTIQAAREAGY